MGLVDKTKLGPGGEVFIDNYFTGLNLLDQLSAMGVGATGTIRQDRTCKAPLPQKKDMKKQERGTTATVYTGDSFMCTLA